MSKEAPKQRSQLANLVTLGVVIGICTYAAGLQGAEGLNTDVSLRGLQFGMDPGVFNSRVGAIAGTTTFCILGSLFASAATRNPIPFALGISFATAGSYYIGAGHGLPFELNSAIDSFLPSSWFNPEVQQLADLSDFLAETNPEVAAGVTYTDQYVASLNASNEPLPQYLQNQVNRYTAARTEYLNAYDDMRNYAAKSSVHIAGTDAALQSQEVMKEKILKVKQLEDSYRANSLLLQFMQEDKPSFTT